MQEVWIYTLLSVILVSLISFVGLLTFSIKVAKLKEITLSKRDFIELMYSVAEKTYNNKNSMLQDILRRKPTEIDFLNGRIVEFAKELNIKVPINEVLTFLIKGLERSFR